MLPSAPLDFVPLWALFIATLAVILLATNVGFRLGRRRVRRAEHEKEQQVGGMVAAELGLLAFLLAFTYGMAGERFETRRQVLLDETNAIGTAYLRAAMLPEPHGTEIRRLLREYVDVRLAAVQKASLAEVIRRSNELHRRLWSEAVSAAKDDPRSVPTGLFIHALNEVIDIHAKRLMFGARNRIPVIVWIVLYVVAVLSFGALGYQSGLSGTKLSPAVVPIALTFATVMWLVADLDRPQRGLIRVSQQPMIELRDSMTGPGS